MPDVQITCITKSHNNGSHEHITCVGNPSVPWKCPTAQVIESIDRKTNTFFVQDPHTRKRADVGVVRPPGSPAYLRTYADGLWNDNLLAQKQCSSSC
jgi:hypothetical protein